MLVTLHLNHWFDLYAAFSIARSMILGQPVNLNQGLKYSGIHDGNFYPSARPTIFTDDIQVTTKEETHSGHFNIFPSLDFCDNFTHLVQTFFDFIHPSDGFVAVGFMVQPGQDSSNELADLIGVRHEDANFKDAGNTAFVLARQWRKSKSVSLKTSFPTIVNPLNLALNDASATYQSYMDVTVNYGTHYLSNYTTGDFVYQVFSYGKDEYSRIKARIPSQPESAFFQFRTYTEPKNEYVGHCKYYGPVKIASADKRFESDIVPHLRDVAYNVRASIFQVIAHRSVFQTLNNLNRETIIGMELKSMGNYASGTVNHLKWLGLMHSSFFAKYGVMVNPSFGVTQLPIDYSVAYAQFAPLYPTLTPTYFLGIKFLYLHLNKVNILQPEIVKTTFLFADTIEVTSDVSIPGNENVVILCNNFLSKSVGSFVPTVTLGIDPRNTTAFKFYATNFIGALQLQNSASSSQLTIYNGHSLLLQAQSSKTNMPLVHLGPNYFNLVPDANAAPFLYRHISNMHGQNLLRESFQNGLSFFVNSIESILNFNIGVKGPEAAYHFSDWIVATLSHPSISSESTLKNFYTRALVLRKTRSPGRSTFAASVPYLSYTMYQHSITALLSVAEEYGAKMDHVENVISNHRASERIAANQNVLNENIRTIAKFLVQQNQATATQ